MSSPQGSSNSGATYRDGNVVYNGRLTDYERLSRAVVELMDTLIDSPVSARASLDAFLGPFPRAAALNTLGSYVRSFFENVPSSHPILTTEHIETAVRFHPQVLETRYRVDFYNVPLLIFLARDLRSISFVPTIVKLAKEFEDDVHGYSQENRWGLLETWDDDDDVDDKNFLVHLATFGSTFRDKKECRKLSDQRTLFVMQELREMNLFHASDVVDYDLLNYICRTEYFSKRRFFYLVQLNPRALASKNDFGCVPLHSLALGISICSRPFEPFKFVFALGIRYFASEFGFLFHKDDDDKTPYFYVCYDNGKSRVDALVDEYLVTLYRLEQLKLLISLASNPDVHLDGIFVLMRRNPSFAAAAIHDNNHEAGGGNIALTNTSKRKVRRGRKNKLRPKPKRRSKRLQNVNIGLTRSGNQFR